MLDESPPAGQADIERFLLETLPSLGPPPRGIEGFARAQRFFASIGDPQNEARQIHVVGTAGKGTAAGAIVGRLVAAGHTVGAHLSPHVYDLRERFLLNGGLPGWDDVGRAMADMWPAMHAMVDDDGRPPSFFETMTAISWLIANRAGAEYHVTEAGIGGTYDSTNAIDRADKVTVVTSIGFDHVEILGPGLVDIAANKADVIRPGGVAVMGPQPHDVAADVVRTTAARRKATLVEVGDLSMDFAAQAEAIGDAVVEILDVGASDDLRAAVHLPGRAERRDHRGVAVVLDGAHNPLKIRALVDHVGPSAIAIVALSSEKDLDACAVELAALAPVIVTGQFAVTAGGRVVRQSWPSPELAAAIRAADESVTVIESTDVEAAARVALDLAAPGDQVVASGSFMMIDDVRSALDS